ncbi:hypothetical protein [Mucilaginibacter puniceus]
MKRILLSCLLPLFITTTAFADTISVDRFVVKENPFAENEIAIVAVDSAENIRESVNGVFNFTLNGFKQDLVFDKGTAFYRQKLDKSSFLYVKHINESGTHSVLYYVYKHSGKITPIRISWILLIAIPIGLILLGYIFKRFIIIAAVIFCIFLYFNHHNGLSIPTFFESIFDGLRGLF